MLYLEIEGTPVQIPQEWKDVTWGQAVRFYSDPPKDGPELVAIFTPWDADWWRQYRSAKQYLALVHGLSFLTDPARQDAHLKQLERTPTAISVTIEGKQIDMPTDLLDLPVGQFQDAAFVADELLRIMRGEDGYEIADVLKHSRTLFCIYLQPYLDGTDYDASRVSAINIDDARFYAVIQWRNFFLTSTIALLSGTESNPSQSATLPKSRRRGMKTFRRLGALLRRFTV